MRYSMATAEPFVAFLSFVADFLTGSGSWDTRDRIGDARSLRIFFSALEVLVAAFNGKSFLLGIQHLDSGSRDLFERHGNNINGRWSFVEQIVDEAMVRMVSNLQSPGPHGIDGDC